MSSEAADKVQKVFIDNLGARYPYVTVDKADVQKYGIRGYPTYMLVDPDGKVQSQAHGVPAENKIEELLKHATVGPRLPDGAQYGPLRSMWKKKQFKKISDYLTKMLDQSNLDGEMREIFEHQQKTLERRLAGQERKVEKAADGPDYHRAYETLSEISKEWKGFPVAERAKAEMARFKADARIKKEMSSAKGLARLLQKYDRGSISQNRKLMAELSKFADAKKHRGTWAATEARRILSNG